MLSFPALETTETERIVVNGDGSFSYDPSTLFVSLPAGATTVDTFSYTMEDSEGEETTAGSSLMERAAIGSMAPMTVELST